MTTKKKAAATGLTITSSIKLNNIQLDREVIEEGFLRARQ